MQLATYLFTKNYVAVISELLCETYQPLLQLWQFLYLGYGSSFPIVSLNNLHRHMHCSRAVLEELGSQAHDCVSVNVRQKNITVILTDYYSKKKTKVMICWNYRTNQLLQLTKFLFCCWVDDLKARVGNSLRRYLIHFSTISLETKSASEQCRHFNMHFCLLLMLKPSIPLPILFRTRTIFLLVPLWTTACSTCGQRQPKGSLASRTSKITSAASITWYKKNHKVNCH